MGWREAPVIGPTQEGVPVTTMVGPRMPAHFGLPPEPRPKLPPFIGGLTEAFAGPYQALVGGEEYAKTYEPYRQASMPATPLGSLGYLAGQAAPYLGVPGGTAGGFMRRGATGALAGGAQGGLAYVPPGESRMRQGVLGLGTGAAVPMALLGLKRAGDYSRGPGAPLATPERLQPYNPTLAQVTRDPSDWAVERNLARRDPEGLLLAERFSQQNQQLIQEAAARRATEEPFQTATAAQRVAKARDRMTQIPVKNAYSYAKTAIGSNLELDTHNMGSQWRAILDDFEDRIPPNIKRRVESFIPVFDDDGNLVSGGRPYTPNEINKAIQLINTELDDFQLPAAVRKGLNSTKQLLDEDLKAFEEADIAEAAEAWRAARKLAAERFRQRGGSRKGPIAELVKKDFKTETWINRHIVGGETKDVEKLFNYFRGYRRGDEVLHNIARQIDEHLYNKAVSKAEIEFRGTNYRDALKRIGEAKGRIIFGDEGWESRMQFAETARELTTTPFGAAVNWSNTAPTLFGYMDAAGLGRFPFIRNFVQDLRRGAREGAQRRVQRSALERRPLQVNDAYQRWVEKLAPAAPAAIQTLRAGAVPTAIELAR